MRIEVNAAALRKEARNLNRLADEAEYARKGARKAIDENPMIPGYAKDAGQAVNDVQRSIDQLRAAADVMVARAFLADLASRPGMERLGRQLEHFEWSRPLEFGKTLLEVAAGMRIVKRLERGTEILALQTIITLSRARLNIPDRDLRLARKILASGAKHWSIYRKLTNPHLRAKEIAVALEQLERRIPRWKLRVMGKTLDGLDHGLGPFGLLTDAAIQYYNDQDDKFRDGDRLRRLGYALGWSAVGSTAGVTVAAAACPETGGTGCVVAITAAGAVAANYAASWTNDTLFPSESDRREQVDQKRLEDEERRYERELREFRKLERWYVDNGDPSTQYLDERLEGASEQVLRSGTGTVTHYWRPDDHKLLATRYVENGQERTVYFNERGLPIHT